MWKGITALPSFYTLFSFVWFVCVGMLDVAPFRPAVLSGPAGNVFFCGFAEGNRHLGLDSRFTERFLCCCWADFTAPCALVAAVITIVAAT